MPGQNTLTDPVVTENPLTWEQELSRLCTVNGITSSNVAAVVNGLSDAQIAGFVRRWIITGFKIVP